MPVEHITRDNITKWKLRIHFICIIFIGVYRFIWCSSNTKPFVFLLSTLCTFQNSSAHVLCSILKIDIDLCNPNILFTGDDFFQLKSNVSLRTLLYLTPEWSFVENCLDTYANIFICFGLSAAVISCSYAIFMETEGYIRFCEILSSKMTLPPAYELCGKAMFSLVSVILSTVGRGWYSL